MCYKEKIMFKHAKIFAVIIALVFLPATVFLALVPGTGDMGKVNAGVPEISISVDREVYHSSEEMKLNINVKLPAKENVTVRVRGIPDRSGSCRINEERNVSAGPEGTNEIFAFRLPSCYGCAGVSPGDYEIAVEIIRDGEIIGNCSKTVKLEV